MVAVDQAIVVELFRSRTSRSELRACTKTEKDYVLHSVELALHGRFTWRKIPCRVMSEM